MASIYDIWDVPEKILEDVGGKARGLNRLISFGFDVPEAFIVTDINDGDDLSIVKDKYVSSGFGEVSVRSSATMEDGTDFSAAGQFSTVLNISGEDDVLEAVRNCIASLHSQTAENYSKVFLKSKENRMTVVVQKMVNPRCAGVIFSKAPMKPDQVLVEAVPGLGENLVSGKMKAQQYYVNGYKVESVLSGEPILSNDEVLSLAEMARKAEELFGTPQDLEWAIDEYGNIFWLQARPITIGETVPIDELDSKNDTAGQVFTTGNIGEVVPGAVTPLSLSTTIYALDWGIKEALERLGVSQKHEPYSFISPFSNHLFFNMTSIYSMGHLMYGTSKEGTDLSICGVVLDGYPDTDCKAAPLLRRIYNTVRFVRVAFDGNSPRKNIDRVVDTMKFDLQQDAAGIYKQILENFDLLNLANLYHYHASIYSGGQLSFLNTELNPFFEDKQKQQAAIASCLTQIEDFESANILRMMTNLARIIAEECPSAVSYSQTQLMKHIREKASDKVKDAYDTFMQRHGHRGIREMEMRSLSWKANQMSFFSSLRSVIVSLDKDGVREEKPWKECAEELLSLFSSSKRKRIMGFIEKARKGVCLREYTKSRVVYLVDLYKQAYLRLAELMVQKGMLPDTDSIYFLTQDEVGKVLAGDRSLVKRAIARKRLFPRQQRLSYPFVTLGKPLPVSDKANRGNEMVLSGTPVSRGCATGRARIVRDENDASHLENGEIMVAASSDVGWTPYYNVIAGMVTEIGSSLSHGVVVAREYSLPAVVNVSDAMNIIRNGDMVSIDGDKGTVTIEK